MDGFPVTCPFSTLSSLLPALPFTSSSYLRIFNRLTSGFSEDKELGSGQGGTRLGRRVSEVGKELPSGPVSSFVKEKTK